MQTIIEVVQQRWAELSRRERLFVAGGLAVVSAMLVFVLVVEPLLGHLRDLDRKIARLDRTLEELAVLGAEQADLSAKLRRVDARVAKGREGFALLPFLEDAAEKARVRERITGMQPQRLPASKGYQETAVEIRLENVDITQVLDLLTRIDRTEGLAQVRRLQLKPRFDNPESMAVTLRVSSYAKP